MADLKKDLKAHKDRAVRAQKNVDQGRRDFAAAKSPSLRAKARWFIHHNIAVRNIERARAARVAKQIKGVTGRDKTVRWALSRVGVVEHPAFSNSGPFISDWIRQGGGEPGYAWCQYFCNAGLHVGGGIQLTSGYTPQVVEWAKNHEFDLKLVPLSKARRGDFVYFKFPGVSGDICDHVGLFISQDSNGVTCVEGNTSPSQAGSQNNGGGVFRKIRSKSLVAFVVQPTYLGDI